MTTTNKPMTGEQLDELMTVAVNMQRDSEKAGERPVAMFAYAVQVAVLELRKVRGDVAQLAAENAGLIEQAEEVYATGYNHGHLNTVDGIAYADCVKDDFYGLAVELMREAETPVTDAFLTEVRAQGVQMFAAEMGEFHAKCQAGGYFDRQVQVYGKAQELAESYLKQRSQETAQ